MYKIIAHHRNEHHIAQNMGPICIEIHMSGLYNAGMEKIHERACNFNIN